MIDFKLSLPGTLVDYRRDSFVARDTGEENTFYRVDLILDYDDGKRVASLTCGNHVMRDFAGKPGSKVVVDVVPAVKQGRIGVRLLSIALA